jgi:hypothetical protein
LQSRQLACAALKSLNPRLRLWAMDPRGFGPAGGIPADPSHAGGRFKFALVDLAIHKIQTS